MKFYLRACSKSYGAAQDSFIYTILCSI